MRPFYRISRSDDPALILLALLLWWTPAAGGVDRRGLSNHVPRPVSTGSAIRVGRLPAATRIDAAISLRLRDPEGLRELLGRITDPASSDYRQYLSPDEFTARFGPTAQDYRALAEFAAANGLTIVGTTPNRMLLDVSGTASAFERAFQCTLGRFHDLSRHVEFYAPESEPSVPQDLPVLEILGLDNFSPPRPADRKTHRAAASASYNTGSGPGGLYISKDLRAAYAPGVTLDGAGQAVGIFGGPYFPETIATYAKATGLRPVPLQNVLVNVSSDVPEAGKEDGEAVLDIEMAMAMAPGLSRILVYEGTNWIDIFNRMATDNLARQLSCSWAFSPTPATLDQILQQFAAQGQTLFVASGDVGAATLAENPWAPTDHPYVTSVGGTYLTTKGAGGDYASETAWPLSTGGVTRNYPIPGWQKSVSMSANGGSTVQRNYPDVAMVADYLFSKSEGAYYYWSRGTSASAPLWAGFTALVNQRAAALGAQPVGYLNPALYRLGGGPWYSADFHDVTAGSNPNQDTRNSFNAVAGFDLVTGWGSPTADLIDDLAAPPQWQAISLKYPRVSATPANGCSPIPPAATTFTTADHAVNLFFGATVGASDALSSVWTAPDGATRAGAWKSTSGTTCFQAQIDISALPGAQLGAWKVAVSDGGKLVFSLPFTVTAPPPPAVNISQADGVVNGANFYALLAPGAWMTVRGTNLSQTTRSWSGADFKGSQMPVSLDGVSVRFNGQPGYISYISPTQINVLSPGNTALGSVNVEVSNSKGTSNTVVAKSESLSAGLFTFGSAAGLTYAAVTSGAAYIAPAGFWGSAAASRPANAGEVVTLWATGLGPAVKPPAEGQTFSGALPLSFTPSVTICGAAATLSFTGMVSPGLYQLNVAVPDPPGAASGATVTCPIVVAAGSFRPATGASMPVRTR